MNENGTTASRAAVGVVVTALLTAAAACGNQVAMGAKPPVLHLSSQSGTRAMGVAEPAAPAGGNQQGGYVLTGTLPADQPADQPVYRPAEATKSDAEHVAKALNLNGSVTRISGGWVQRAPDTMRLIVNDSGSWSFGMDCFADQPIDKESADVMCASASGGGVAVGGTSTAEPITAAPAPPPTAKPPAKPPTVKPTSAPVITTYPTPPPGPSAQQAQQDAQPVLTALGLSDAEVTAQQSSPWSYVVADPSIGGKPTVGWSTSLQYDANDKFVGGNGWLIDTTKGDSYPVITAQRAFELLKTTPVAYPLICMVRKDGKPGCEPPQPMKVTGAKLGLMLDQDQKGSILVPAWLFAIDGQTQPVAQLAIDPAYIASPTTPTPEPGGPVNSTSPESVPPAPPSASPATPK